MLGQIWANVNSQENPAVAVALADVSSKNQSYWGYGIYSQANVGPMLSQRLDSTMKENQLLLL